MGTVDAVSAVVPARASRLLSVSPSR